MVWPGMSATDAVAAVPPPPFAAEPFAAEEVFLGRRSDHRALRLWLLLVGNCAFALSQQ